MAKCGHYVQGYVQFRMELDAISVFVKVVESGSFSGAARLLRMPKTTVSAKVAALERRLGVTLIRRTTRKLHVTDAGQNYFHHCALAIKEIEKGESELLAEQVKPQGLIRVTAPADFGHTVLPRIVSEYIKKYPETEVELIVTNRIVDLIGEGIDLALRAGELQDSTLIARKYFESHGALWASPAYLKKYGDPDHPRLLPKYRIISRTGLPARSLEFTDGKSTFILSHKSQVRADDFEAVKSFLLLKQGIGYLPDFLCQKEAKTKELVQVLPKWRMKNPGVFSFVYPGQKYASPKIRAFIETALESAPCQNIER
jgi:DNA-binding transcriptional LysR family regulator